MASQTPVIRQVSLIGIIPLIVTVIVAAILGGLLLGEKGPPFGVGAAFICIVFSRMLIFRYHRMGIALVKRGRFADAIPIFQRSLDFFDHHSWIDRYRSIVMMSLSALSYREMAIANMAFCYSQIGNGVQARKQYEECLRRFPDSGLAIASLRMLDAGQSSKPV